MLESLVLGPRVFRDSFEDRSRASTYRQASPGIVLYDARASFVSLLETKILGGIDQLLLSMLEDNRLGVRELAKRMRRRPASVIMELRRLEDKGLAVFRPESQHDRGRPKKVPVVTELGAEYLRSLRQMESKVLLSGRADIERVRRDLELKHRSVSRGKHPHDLFVELRDAIVDIRDAE